MQQLGTIINLSYHLLHWVLTINNQSQQDLSVLFPIDLLVNNKQPLKPEDVIDCNYCAIDCKYGCTVSPINKETP